MVRQQNVIGPEPGLLPLTSQKFLRTGRLELRSSSVALNFKAHPVRVKRPKYGIRRVSISGIVTMASSRYLAFGYLDP